MKRENGVYNFSIKVPEEELRNREERMHMRGNIYAALVENDEEDFQRQGSNMR